LIQAKEDKGEHEEEVSAVTLPSEPVRRYGHQDEGEQDQHQMHKVILIRGVQDWQRQREENSTMNRFKISHFSLSEPQY
jgi:hypothetical protein